LLSRSTNPPRGGSGGSGCEYLRVALDVLRPPRSSSRCGLRTSRPTGARRESPRGAAPAGRFRRLTPHRLRGPLPGARGEGGIPLQGAMHQGSQPLYLPAVSEPPTMRSQVPFGSLMNSLALLSLLLWPAQACAPPAQSFLPALATP